MLPDVIKLVFALIVSKLAVVVGVRPRIWLVCERSDESRDNGYHFFKYVRNCSPDTEIYYVISSTSPDYKRVAAHGPIIKWGSLRHYLYWCLAECIVSTHARRCGPVPSLCRRIVEWGWVTHKSVWLMHGVSAIAFGNAYLKTVEEHDLICVSTLPERKMLAETAGHGYEVVQLVGLCRFDALHRVRPLRRQILLMPTWRQWFRGLEQRIGSERAEEVFLSSQYFKHYHSLLASEELHRLLEVYDYDLVFYPHYEMQPYLALFEAMHSRIILAKKKDYDVQQLLMESAVMVTDFSSVSFDFAYMGKPVLYFLFDEARFFAEHTERGYFDFERDGFGPVSRDKQSLIEDLSEMLEQGGTLELSYRGRVQGFFPLRDNQNCERTYRATLELLSTESKERG